MTPHSPIASVSLPFFNARKTLRAAVYSVVAQSFEDWELILYDDGSVDSSLEIATSFQDRRIRVCGVETNQGLSRSFNTITTLARGKYLARMDADDLMHPDRLAEQVRLLESHPEIDLVGSAAYVLNDSDTPIGIRCAHAPDTSPAVILRRGLFMHPTVMGRTDWFRRNPYDETLPRAEDRELWCRAAKGGTKFGHISKPLLLYRDHRGGVRKYLRSCRGDALVYRRHGPELVGGFAMRGLIAEAYLKGVVYCGAAAMGLEARLLRARNRPLTKEQFQDATALLNRFRRLRQ